MNLGEQIRAHRIRLGLSQDALAERMEVSRQAVTKWESGRSAPSTEKLLKLSALFGCSLDELAGNPPLEDAAPEPDPIPASPEDAPSPAQPLQTPTHRRLDALRRNCTAALITALVWLVWYFLCKLVWADLGDQTVLGWLLGDAPLYHDYLFGWLLDKYWYCALIAVIPALFGKFRFSAVTTAAFMAALVLGEGLGQIRTGPGVHQGWLIWGGVYLAGIVLGVTAQRMRRKFWRSGLWWTAAVGAVMVITVLALMDPPQYC